ncbi:sulfatase-like hydrolase/transferase [Flammeovirga yaeyamensis]|uniref:Sulfatase-like hydrolase/transferase n=1 Tax=Flammeovirga yaeyamensis TaxID=367791 RepID=A0AAX1ND21_9BACT|nr:sulfatase-like hydrolase/transferase [Flammeovirga yaeyamensis]MBB3696952.1 arylsulfatase A-like enzyme [Flammeovirga yaeyamensis]NMF33615.1 sulfatase-like hydrolase/transferase [Flammeovirga yaeyamensis]QWG05117.1 sulfatase-like hydrolase/transferase [Flammeovirga yaeyamensis]
MKYILLLLSLLCLIGNLNAQTNSTKPNIILILSDDAGYADFGFQGSKVMKTPALDKLASQSIVCPQAYVAGAVCGPSRAALLTGKYQQRFGFEENNVPGYMQNYQLADDDMGLPLDQKTIGNYMQEIGYKTGIIGKWHMGNTDQFHPSKRGFDFFYGFRGGARSYWPFDDSNPNHRKEDRMERGFKHFEEPEGYLTDVFAEETIQFIDAYQKEPFFLFLSFNAVHTPMHAKEEDLNEFPELEGKRKQLAAMTFTMDKACQSIFDHLKKSGLDKNTIIIYTNDNGGPTDANASDNSPLSGTKANHYEGGIRVPFVFHMPNNKKFPGEYLPSVSTLDLLPTCYALGGGEVENLEGIDGVNLLPYFKGDKSEVPHQTLYWKKENRGAIRDGNWKFLRFPDRPAELYDLSSDLSEVNNLADQYPEKIKEYYKMLFEWELTLARPRWQLQRKYEGAAMERIDKYKNNKVNNR